MNGGLRIPVRIHPRVPAGTIIGWAEHLPIQYQSNEVPNVAEIKSRQDYYQIDWPMTTRQRQVGVYAEEVLAIYAPFAIYGDLFFGQTPATGQLTVSENEAATIPATTPYTVTVANAASYVDDLGVFYATGASAGNRFTRVTTPSAAGQYSVNLTTGIYTFAAADANASLLISYLYNVSSSGKKLVLTNQFMGYTPTFKATFYTTKTTGGTPAGLALVLNACTAMKLSLPTKTDDYEIQEFDFSAFADPTGTIGTLSVNE